MPKIKFAKLVIRLIHAKNPIIILTLTKTQIVNFYFQNRSATQQKKIHYNIVQGTLQEKSFRKCF